MPCPPRGSRAPGLAVAVLLGSILGSPGCNEYGYAELSVTDIFQQGGVGVQSDVLLVVDDSASMADEQERLVAGFAGFTDVLETTSADFQLGIVTTDAQAGATLRGEVLTPESQDLTAAFLEAVAVGTGGDRVEQGLIQALLAANPAINPGFLRPGAELHVLVVSDEDDQGDEEVAWYLHELQSLAGQDRVTVHGLVGDMPAGCASGTSAADPGPRYLEAVGSTGGRRGSVCSVDYTPVLGQVGLDVAQWNDRFVLSRIPEVETLQVRVDQVLMPQREEDGWTWSAGENAVVFTGRAIPRPGMAVQVDYEIDVGGQAGTDPGDSGG
ncbi:hypothetical protein L6R53_01530 [Myxococcota bacterium]|nr:hypothetical protein [Myxococcota bacterium]